MPVTDPSIVYSLLAQKAAAKARSYPSSNTHLPCRVPNAKSTANQHKSKAISLPLMSRLKWRASESA
jgi:hypothetical protein